MSNLDRESLLHQMPEGDRIEGIVEYREIHVTSRDAAGSIHHTDIAVMHEERNGNVVDRTVINRPSGQSALNLHQSDETMALLNNGHNTERHLSIEPSSSNNHSNDKSRSYSWVFYSIIAVLIIIAVSVASYESFQRFSKVPVSKFKILFDPVDQTYFAVDDKDNSRVYSRAKYILNVEKEGWNHLEVKHEGKQFSLADDVQTSDLNSVATDYFDAMRSVGYIEGYVTCNEISQWYVNFYSGLFDGGDPKPQSVQFLKDNYAWMKMSADANWKTSNYWFVVAGYLAQLEGMADGYNEGCPAEKRSTRYGGAYLPSMHKGAELIHFLLMNADGDLYQIAEKFNQEDAPPSDKNETMSAPEYSGRRKIPSANKHRRRDHCSAIIKLLPDNSDVLFGHNTWDDFQNAAPRIFKYYSLPDIKLGTFQDLKEDDMNVITSTGFIYNNHDVYFSSSPGLMSSVDDFFIVKGRGKLAVTETTIDVYNKDLLDLVVPTTLLSWFRSRLANQLAQNGADWAENFLRYSSGTYVNEWMVLDLQKFGVGTGLSPGFLTVLEEVPSDAKYDDLTKSLEITSYWASYNNPFFDEIALLSGNTEMCYQNPDNCHESDPRAKIFREKQKTIRNLEGLKSVMGYNNFQHDPLSKNDSCNAISCRQDLHPIPAYRYPFGAIDAKISSVVLASQQTPVVLGRLGPTHDQQPVFCWDQVSRIRNRRGFELSHEGHPDCFAFGWVQLPPRK